MIGLSTIGSISLGWALVAGRKRVPSPAAGNTALRTFIFMEIFRFQVLGRPSFTRRTIVSGAFDNWRPGELERTPSALHSLRMFLVCHGAHFRCRFFAGQLL